MKSTIFILLKSNSTIIKIDIIFPGLKKVFKFCPQKGLGKFRPLNNLRAGLHLHLGRGTCSEETTTG